MLLNGWGLLNQWSPSVTGIVNGWGPLNAWTGTTAPAGPPEISSGTLISEPATMVGAVISVPTVPENQPGWYGTTWFKSPWYGSSWYGSVTPAIVIIPSAIQAEPSTMIGAALTVVTPPGIVNISSGVIQSESSTMIGANLVISDPSVAKTISAGNLQSELSSLTGGAVTVIIQIPVLSAPSAQEGGKSVRPFVTVATGLRSTIYAVIVDQGDNPSDVQIAAGLQSNGSAAYGATSKYITVNGVTALPRISHLTQSTPYAVYMVGKNLDNVYSNVVSVNFTTKLIPVGSGGGCVSRVLLLKS